jgi:oligopeptide/dipeptide ABC transporter ATP-binding protein
VSLLSARRLHVRYALAGAFTARLAGLRNRWLDAVLDVSFDLAAGRTLAIVGESGSGKSTLARAIAGLLPIAGGRVLFDGKDPFANGRRGDRAYHRDVALMFQDPVSSLSPRRTVESLVTEPFIIHGMRREKDLTAEAARLLRLVGLPRDFAMRYPHQLSGGQARRVGVARAIALNPKLIIADEPTAGLDVSVQGEILNLLVRLQGEFGIAYMIITHNLPVVRHVSDDTAIMYMGRIVERGPTAAVFASPAHPYTGALIAAQPSPDPRRRRLGAVLSGEVASLRHRPPGCEFHPRCPRAGDTCRRDLPPAETIGRDRLARCHFPLVP